MNKKNIKSVEKAMWELYPELWKTESAYMSWVRGGVRRGLWNKHPIKLQFLNENTVLVKNTNPRSMKRYPTVKRCKCVFCKGLFSTNSVEVDHIKGNHSLKNIDEIGTFIKSIIEITKEDLQIVCKDCHRIKSFAEKNDISFEEALAEKQAIALVKAKKDKSWLEDRGIIPTSNQKKRREQIKRHILSEGVLDAK